MPPQAAEWRLNMKKNLVVVGYGGMGGWHTQHALKSDVVSLAGIYDIDPKRALLRASAVFSRTIRLRTF